jgi:hypothetical protein
MEALYPLTPEVLDALDAHVAVLDGQGVVIGVNSRWRRGGCVNGVETKCVGDNYLDVCLGGSSLTERAARRVQRRLARLLQGQLESFVLAYRCAGRVFRLRATRVAEAPMRVLLAHEDITRMLEARRKLHDASRGLRRARNRHAVRIDQAYEQLGQRLAAIALATHAIERAGAATPAVNTIRIALDEARLELRRLRYEAETDSGPSGS